ncbi:hypothetical protein [Desertihabitans aurantiacus]|uniref:hypothetical protein n=1 Tax=Desertihabitans aurantiacus TaxID=2282477 RepID=UPI0013007DE2|nr:hypothetical protein [Desertihabitans aurantiacus]
MASERFDIRQPFRRRAGIRAGFTDHQLRGPAFRRLFVDCFVAAGVPLTPSLLARAALLVRPGAGFASHHTAALLLDAAVPACPEVHLGTTGTAQSRRGGVVEHRYARKPQLVRRYGVLATSASATFLDLAASLSLVELVVLGDSLVRKGHTSPDALIEAATSYTGRGARRAREAAQLVRSGVDSPRETQTRLLLVFAGLPEPAVDVRIRDEDGEVVRRLDLAYEHALLAIEYDGRQHIERQQSWREDIGRVRSWRTPAGASSSWSPTTSRWFPAPPSPGWWPP